jgi:hypothetical protein
MLLALRACEFARQMLENTECAFGLCDRRALQPGRDFDRILLFGGFNVCVWFYSALATY